MDCVLIISLEFNRLQEERASRVHIVVAEVVTIPTLSFWSSPCLIGSCETSACQCDEGPFAKVGAIRRGSLQLTKHPCAPPTTTATVINSNLKGKQTSTCLQCASSLESETGFKSVLSATLHAAWQEIKKMENGKRWRRRSHLPCARPGRCCGKRSSNYSSHLLLTTFALYPCHLLSSALLRHFYSSSSLKMRQEGHTGCAQMFEDS